MEQLKNDIWRIYGKYQRNGVYRNSKIDRIERRVQRIDTVRYLNVKKQIEILYFQEKYGIKLLARKLGLTYTVTRQLMQFLNIPIRKGRNIVTDRVKKLRKEKAIYESKNKIGFNDPSISRKYEGMARGVQGYYLNKSTNEYVWLRSSWEYIFAKWLDKTKHNWKVEETHYLIEGSIYRPDFFIYDDEWKLKSIIEIKGYWDSNSDKAKKLNESIDVDIIIIRDIKKYIIGNSNYHRELAEWKTKRITKNGKDKKNKIG